MRRSGTIWFSAHSSLSQGVYVLDPQTGQVNPVIHDTINPGHINSIHTRSICEDRSGDIWTGNAKGLHKFNAAKGSFLHYRNDPGDPHSISNDTVISIFEDRSGTLWIGTCNGLNQFDSKREQFIRYVHESDNPNSLNGNFIGAITEDIEGNLIIKTTTGINFLDKQKRAFDFWEYSDLFYPFTPRSGLNYFISIRSIDLDTCDILWFTTTTRFDKLILKKKKFTSLRSIYSLSSIFQDNTGDLWVGTWYNGLYRIITDHSGRTLGSLKNTIWDGTNPVSGIHHYDNNPEDPYSLSSECIISICQDREGTMWIGGGHSGILYKLDPSDKRERFIPYRQDSLTWISNWKLIRVHEDRSGNLWIGRDIGLEIFNRETEKFMPYDLDPEKHEFQNIPFINAICEGDSGYIWVGTWFQGLFKIMPPITISTSGTAKGDRTVSYKYDQEVPKNLGDHPVLSLCAPKIRKTAELWIGTSGGGLFGLTREGSSPGKYTERFIHYTTEDGLSSFNI
jgi:ligand-binding sensor domain-containing protein